MELNASDVQHKGIKESQGKTSYELDWNFIEEMSKRMDANKGKYPPYNWHKPIDINSLKQAVARHHTQFQLGNYEDDGQPYGHILGIACNLMMIYYQLTAYKPLTREEIKVEDELDNWVKKHHEEYINALLKRESEKSSVNYFVNGIPTKL